MAQPNRTAEANCTGSKTAAASGLVASRRKAASPIVAISAATSAPKPTLPLA